MTTCTRCTTLLGSVLACGPSVGDPGGEGDGSGGSESSAASGTSGVSASSTSADDSSSSSSSGESSSSSTGEPVPAACAAVGWDASYDAFRTLVEQADGRYWYSSRYAVYYSGFSPDCWYTTTIEVADGVVIRRILAEPELAPMGDPMACSDPPFDEMGGDVGAHDDFPAGPTWLLDRFYESCCEDVLSIEPADDYDITFSTFDNGVVRDCYAFEHDCADGCDFGPAQFGSNSIDAFGLGPLPP